MMLRQISCLAAALMLVACGDHGSPPAAAPRLPIVVAAVPTAATQPASGPSFADWRNRLDALLPAADLAELASMPATGAERTVRPDQLRYRWDAGRSFIYAGTRMNRKNLVSLGQLRTGIRPEEFAARHFLQPDEQQRARHAEAIDREAKRRGLDEQSTETAHLLADAIARRQPAEAIDGIGDAAAWAASATDPMLHMRVGASTISLVVDVSDDPTINRAMALALATRVVERVRSGDSP